MDVPADAPERKKFVFFMLDDSKWCDICAVLIGNMLI